jgi:hypothetical protein
MPSTHTHSARTQPATDYLTKRLPHKEALPDIVGLTSLPTRCQHSKVCGGWAVGDAS